MIRHDRLASNENNPLADVLDKARASAPAKVPDTPFASEWCCACVIPVSCQAKEGDRNTVPAGCELAVVVVVAITWKSGSGQKSCWQCAGYTAQGSCSPVACAAGYFEQQLSECASETT